MAYALFARAVDCRPNVDVYRLRVDIADFGLIATLTCGFVRTNCDLQHAKDAPAVAASRAGTATTTMRMCLATIWVTPFEDVIGSWSLPLSFWFRCAITTCATELERGPSGSCRFAPHWHCARDT